MLRWQIQTESLALRDATDLTNSGERLLSWLATQLDRIRRPEHAASCNFAAPSVRRASQQVCDAKAYRQRVLRNGNDSPVPLSESLRLGAQGCFGLNPEEWEVDVQPCTWNTSFCFAYICAVYTTILFHVRSPHASLSSIAWLSFDAWGLFAPSGTKNGKLSILHNSRPYAWDSAGRQNRVAQL